MAAADAESEEAAEAPPISSSHHPEDLVARAIAPVKPQYLRPPPLLRPNSKTTAHDAASEENKGGEAASTVVVKETKKSKRQLKRERQQEKKSVRNLCPEIARTGDAAACKYGLSCRFSHDLDGFLEQKPEDLPGICPFASAGDPCPYGVACRFFKTHDLHSSAPPEAPGGDLKRTTSEVNGLSKDLQKLLWKDRVEFPNADAQLKLLGLVGGKNFKKSNAVQPTGDDVEFGCDFVAADAESRHAKKVKVPVDGVCDAAEADDRLDDVGTTVLDSSRVEVIPVLNSREKKLIDFRGKLYLAPLTTVGNLPFRRVCKNLGADVTCGEMAMCTNLLQGQASEWALLRRHLSEDLFGVQICGAYPDTISRTIELIDRECSFDFVDINMGCPIDVVVNKGAGSALLTKPVRMKNIIQTASRTTNRALTVKVRTGFLEGRNRIDSLVEDIGNWGASAVTIHGRSRQQRYSKLADWDYISKCVGQAPDSVQVLGNGDIFSHLDWNKHFSDCPRLSTCVIARGALIKPWIFTEIKEQRHWDITSGERLDILKKYVNFGLEHWGSDSKGVETTRHFLLEWLSYTCRYVPVGLLDVIPQRLNWRPPSYFGRDSLETLMASDSAADWVKISEMLLGKVPDGFTFTPKHKSNAYDRAENG